jgi:hypothetical protein
VGAANSTANFSVTSEGTLPLSYQWQSNGVAIAGATSTTFSIPNATVASSATYSVSVSNSVATTNISATLTVASPSGYAAQVIADHPAAYWRLSEHSGPVALDSWGTNDGVYAGTEVFSVQGALGGDPNTAVHFAGDGASWVQVPYSSVLNGGLDPNGSFTVECWVKPDNKGSDAGFAVPVASVNLNANRSGYFFLEQPDGWQLRLGNSSGYLAGWNAAAGSVGGEPQANTWYHLVGAYDGVSSTGYIYINGVQVKSNSVDSLAINDAAPFYIGDRGDGAGFAGVVDEVAVYNTNLPPARVLAHYTGGIPPSITIVRSGSNLILTWPSGTLQHADQVTGPYSDVPGATSGMSITPSANQSFYRLRL